jgi:hypothetical protein
MSAPSPPLTGALLLEAVADATVERHQSRHRRVPRRWRRVCAAATTTPRPNSPSLKEM